MLSVLLVFVKTFWKPLAIIVVLLSILGGLRYYGYTEYKRGYKEMQVNYLSCKESFTTEVTKWRSEVTKQQQELEDLNAKKQQVITKTVTIYKDVAKKVEVQKKETTNEIKASIRPTDIVTVPLGFIGVYNSTIEGSRIATGNEGKPEASASTPGVVGKTAVFDALTFTEIMRGNVDVYNEVAARYSALIDLVKGYQEAQK